MQNPLAISVVIPTYNRSQPLIAAIRSVLAQTYPVKEILVCDDGSTDDSEKQVAALNDPRIHWIGCGRNGRPAVPRNTGIKKSTGAYIAFLDSDDEWLPAKLEQQVNALFKNKLKAVCCNASIRKNGQIAGAYLEMPSATLDFKTLVASNYVMCSSMVVEKELLLRCDLFPEAQSLKALEDYALWLRVAALAPVYYLSETLVLYTDDASASIRKDSFDTQQQQQLIFADFKRWCRKRKPAGRKQLLREIEDKFIIKYMNSRERKLHRLKKLLLWR